MSRVPPASDPELPGAILAALRRHHRVPDEPGWRVERAPGGSTDRTFRVLDPGGNPALTARLARPGLALWLRHEERTLRELAAESDGDWLPAGVERIDDASLPGGQLLVHAHVAGTPMATSGVPAGGWTNLGACLARIHRHERETHTIWPSLTPRRGSRAGAFRDRLASLNRYEPARDAVPGAADRMAALAELAANLPASSGWEEPRFALIHGDLSPGNIIWRSDGGVSLIDWEFARDGDPAEDLAYLVSQGNIPPDILAEIAEAYVASGGDPWAFARLPVWLPLVTLDADLWWADRGSG